MDFSVFFISGNRSFLGYKYLRGEEPLGYNRLIKRP
jgi:hypothetical protein